MNASFHPLRRAALALCCAAALPASAQFALAPSPAPHEPFASPAETAQQYRLDAARHLYASYPMNVHQGKLPPLMYAVAMTETDIDPEGRVTSVRFTREPAAAKEVMPWISTLIQRAAPFPAPLGLQGAQTVTEVWLVSKAGKFQLHTLSEGQASSSSHARAD
jgi:hypothetical protein